MKNNRKYTLIWTWLGIAGILGLVLLLLVINHNSNPESFKVGIVIANKDRYEKINGLKAGMVELGLLENRQVEYQIIQLNGDREHIQSKKQLDRLAPEKPDIIVAVGAWETMAAQEVFRDVPIVFVGISSPMDLGLIIQEEHPLLTGIDNGQIKLIGKRMEMLTHLIPTVKKVLVIADSQAPTTKIASSEAAIAAGKLNITIDMLSITTVEQLKSSIQDLMPGQYDAILPLPSLLLEDAIFDVMPLLTSKKILVMGSYPEQAAQGLHASYGISFFEQGKQAANLVAQILDGVPIQSLPIVLPDSIKLAVNKDSMEEIGILLSAQQASLIHGWYGEGG